MASKTEEPNVGVWIFLDDSNLWIEGKKLRGELINNTYFKEDPRGRFNLEELKACVRARPGKRRIETAYLYGSEPPSVQRYWDSARNNGWTVKEFHRSKQNKEKEVDCAISVDITRTVCDKSGPSENKYGFGNRVIVLVSGDKDMRPAINEVVNQEGRWKVEILGYKHSMSSELEKMAVNHKDIVSVHYLDKDITFIEFYCKVTANMSSKIDELRSTLKKRFGCVVSNVKHEVHDQQLLKCIEKLNWPFQFAWFPNSRNCLLYFLQPNVRIEDCPHDYALDHNLKLLKTNHELLNYCEGITTYQEFFKRHGLSQSPEIDTSNRFDHLQDENDTRSIDNLSWDHLDTSSCQNFPLSQRFQDQEEPREERSVNVGFMPDWKAVEKNSGPRLHFVSPKSCTYKYSCVKGFNCRFSHTDSERDHFQKKLPPNHKSKLCNKNPCIYGSKCHYAHGEADLFCGHCGEKGHNREKCKHIAQS